MRSKRVISVFMALSILLTCCACGKPSTNGGATVQKGRYMEAKVTLPLPEGADSQQLIGMCMTDSGMVYYTFCGEGTNENYRVRYYRHTVAADGSVSTQPEQWLNECAPQAGNELSLSTGGDGRMFFTFGDYDENWNAQNHIIVSEDGGKTGKALTGSGFAACNQIIGLAPLADGRIAIQDSDGGILLLDAQGNLLNELEAGEYAGGIAAYENKLAVLSPSGNGIRVYDLANGQSADWAIDVPEAGLSQMAFSADGVLYFACATGLYRHTPDGTLFESFVDGDVTNLGIPSYYMSHIAVEDERHDVIYVGDYEANIYRYAYDSEAAQTPAIELDVFSLVENDMVRQAVVTYNRLNSHVKVNYTVASSLSGGGTDQDYTKALNTELLAGNGPDVILLDGLPLHSYIEKGVLMDIRSTVDAADAILPNIRQAYEQDGSLYAIPLGVRAPVIMGSEAEAFASLTALAQAAQGGETPLLPAIAYSYEALSKMLLSYYGEGLYTGKPEDMLAFLTAAGQIAEAIGSTDVLGAGMEISGITEDQKQALLLQEPFGAQIYAYARGEARCAILEIGALGEGNCMMAATTAEEHGDSLWSIGGKFQPVGLVGINQASKNLDIAADFLSVLLSPDVQGATGLNSQCFPVNEAVLAATLDEVNANVSTGLNFGEGAQISGDWPSAAMRAKLLHIIKALHTPIVKNEELNHMLLPAITAYLDGSMTPGAAEEQLISILTTYLSE